MVPRRIGMEKLREWAKPNLRKGDAVVIETTTNVWDVYDIVEPLVSYTVVAHAGGVRQIAEARVKTDKKDIERLIRLLIRRHCAEKSGTASRSARIARDDLVSQSAGEDEHDGYEIGCKA